VFSFLAGDIILLVQHAVGQWPPILPSSYCCICQSSSVRTTTQWLVVRKRAIPNERPPLVDEFFSPYSCLNATDQGSHKYKAQANLYSLYTQVIAKHDGVELCLERIRIRLYVMKGAVGGGGTLRVAVTLGKTFSLVSRGNIERFVI
jgi:hypothetical protein